MAERAGVVAATVELGPAFFAFLVDQFGFRGPEPERDGIAYHRSGFRVRILPYEAREPGITTILETDGADGTSHARLPSVYTAARLGPSQDVPESARTARVATKRLEQHAKALCKLLRENDDASLQDLVRQRHGT